MAIENFQTKKKSEPEADFIDTDNIGSERKTHKLDSEKKKKRHKRLMAWYQYEQQKQSINRFHQAIDEDFYDHMQWTEEDAQILRERGQAPLVFNLIRPAVDWLIGTERRTRIDYKILPREQSDSDGADLKTQFVKYLSDVNLAPFKRSQAFSEQVKAGVGWLDSGINSFGDGGELLYFRSESWRNVLYDSHSKELDLSDARYIFRWKWVDLDIALSMFPDRKAAIKKAAIHASSMSDEDEADSWYLGKRVSSDEDEAMPMDRRTYISSAGSVDHSRERVKLIECQYRLPATVKRCHGGEFHGAEFDPNNQSMVTALEAGEIELFDSFRMKTMVAIMTEEALLQDMPCPYRHNDFTLTPVWGYRRARDKAPYGYIRGLRDPQEDYNKRSSKALWLMSSNRIVADHDAFEDPDEAREEAARPDMMLLKKKGSTVEIQNNADLAVAQVQLMERDHGLIQGEAGGITRENLGQDTNAQSGKAILAKQEQGSMTSQELFDNYRLAIQLHGQKELSMIEQFYSDQKVIRIVGQKGKVDFKTLNQYDHETDSYLNDITANQADYVVSEQDFRASLRQAMFETLTDLVSRMNPDLAIQFLDLVFDMSDLPNKDEFVSRIRKINGHIDPNAKRTPEEQAEFEQEMQAKQEQAELQKRELMATIEKLEAEIAKTRAQASDIATATVTKAIGTLGKSLTGAAALAANPDLAAIGDAILKSVGFEDKDEAPIIPEQQMAPAMEPAIPPDQAVQPPIME